MFSSWSGGVAWSSSWISTSSARAGRVDCLGEGHWEAKCPHLWHLKHATLAPVLFWFAREVRGQLPPGVRPSGRQSFMEGVVVPNLFVGAPAWDPSRPLVTGAGSIAGFVGWTGMSGRGGCGEGTEGWFARGRGLGTVELVCTNLVTSVVAI